MTPRADNQVAGLGSIAADFIREVLNSYLSQKHWLPWVRFFVVFLCPSRQIQGLSFDTDYSSILHLLSRSLVIIGCTIQH